MRLGLTAVFWGFATFANADPSTLIFDMRCDRALDVIFDSRSDQPVFLSKQERAFVEGFLIGFGLLSSISSSDVAEDAIGKGLGGLFAFCQDMPSRTISELAGNFRR